MKYFLDTEFNGFGGELISLALVKEDGDSLYLARALILNPEPWVAQNVIPLIDRSPVKPKRMPLTEWGWEIAAFIEGDPYPQIIADWPDDIRYLCGLLITGPGEMVPTPQQLHFAVVRVNAYPTELKGAVQHNAWWDAMALRELLSGVKERT